MNSNLNEIIKQNQRYRLLIRHLRKQKEERDSEKADNNKTDCNQSK